MTSPVRLDTVVLSDAFDFDTFVRAVLAGEPVVGMLPSDSDPTSWWGRVWPIIEQSGFAPRMLAAVNRCLTDPAPEVRRSAMAVLENHPDGFTTERIVELIRDHRPLFENVRDPWEGSVDLRWSLLRLLGVKMLEPTDDGRSAVDVGKRLALSDPTTVEPLAAGLASAAPDWTSEHAATLARAAPGVAAAILFNLQRLGHDVCEPGRRMAAVIGRSKRFRSDVKRIVDDEQTRRKILGTRQRE